jgi:hypothetical protein
MALHFAPDNDPSDCPEGVGYLLIDEYNLVDRQHFQIFAKAER